MSYILDALRKSERERKQGELPDLNTFNEGTSAPKHGARWVWIGGGALLVVNLVVAGNWLLQAGRTSEKPALKEPASIADQTSIDNTAHEAAVTSAGATTSEQTKVASAPSAPPATQQPNLEQTGSQPLGSQQIVTAQQPNLQNPSSVQAVQGVAGQVYYVAPPGAVGGAPAVVVLPPGSVPVGSVPVGSVPVGTQFPAGVATPPAGYVPPTGYTPPATNYIPPTSYVPPPNPGSATTVVPPPVAAVPPPYPADFLEQPIESGNSYSQAPTQQRLATASYMPRLEELSPSIRQRVPDLQFSSHMYSSVDRFRSIVVNGTRYREGQFISDGLQIREITETGVILSMDGTLFRVDVLGKWSK
ncbi:hypothetical protein HDN1F_34790 [gamma proteobacterium HdN1]|nr:hypothetical protein HDN1F_34790 [gamma proteobacterium HdN1]